MVVVQIWHIKTRTVSSLCFWQCFQRSSGRGLRPRAQIHLVGNMQPFSVLANMYVDISEFPDHLDVDTALESRKRKVKVLRSMDPFPAISQQDVHNVLSVPGAGRGSFIVHSSDGVTSPVSAFRLLTISFIPPAHGEYLAPPDQFHDDGVTSFHIWMVMPSPEYPQWLPFAGYFTIYNQPWSEADPNPMGVQDDINMFANVQAVCKRFTCLQTRQNPYPQGERDVGRRCYLECVGGRCQHKVITLGAASLCRRRWRFGEVFGTCVGRKMLWGGGWAVIGDGVVHASKLGNSSARQDILVLALPSI